MAVGAGIAVDGSAGPAGDAGQRLQAFQAAVDGEVHQVLQLGAGAGGDAIALGAQGVAAVAQHQAAIPAVGDDQVSAAADHDDRNAAGLGRVKRFEKGVFRAGLGVQIGRPAHAEARMTRQRDAGRKG